MRPADQVYPWLCREWVFAVCGTPSILLTKPTLGSVECKLLLLLAPLPADQAYLWLCRQCVADAPGTLSSLLTGPTLDSAVCKLLLSLALFQACWSSPPLALQKVSCCCFWHPFRPADQAHSWLCREWVTANPDTLSRLLTEHPLGLCRKWVAAGPGTPSSQLTMPILGPAGSELLLSLAHLQAYWPTHSWALQRVSCCWPWHTFKLADQSYPWLCREWVAADPGTPFSLLIKLTLGSAECELLLSLASLQAADQAHPWLYSLWVAAVPGTLSSLLIKLTLNFAGSELLLFLTCFQACWPCLPLALQRVSCCCPLHPFKPADQAHPWLWREWDVALPRSLSNLLTKPTLNSAGCELPLSQHPF